MNTKSTQKVTKLRGVKPTEVKKRIKALFYGTAGVGKTTAAISFPNVYLIDTEQGAIHSQYIRQLDKSNGAVFQTSDFDELLTEVKLLLTENHGFKTLVIDPLTTVYNDLLDKSAIKHGTEFGRHYNDANKKMKHLLGLLTRLDMNVIITSHAKNEYGNNLSVLGQTFDCYKKLDYLFDLVFEIQKRGDQRVAIVKKTRLETFSDSECFPFSYQSISEKYGKDIIEKNSVSETLATQEQIEEISRLIDLLKIDNEVIDKWFDKANAVGFEEMNHSNIQSCIDYLKNKINPNQNDIKVKLAIAQ